MFQRSSSESDLVIYGLKIIRVDQVSQTSINSHQECCSAKSWINFHMRFRLRSNPRSRTGLRRRAASLLTFVSAISLLLQLFSFVLRCASSARSFSWASAFICLNRRHISGFVKMFDLRKAPLRQVSYRCPPSHYPRRMDFYRRRRELRLSKDCH